MHEMRTRTPVQLNSTKGGWFERVVMSTNLTGIIVIESSGWIVIMLAAESSILGILLNLFLIVTEFK